MTNTKPATPLPFSADEEFIRGADGSDAGAMEVSEQNMAYVVHAANAYPQLVEALRKLTAADACNYERETMRYEGLFDNARSILRDLGES